MFWGYAVLCFVFSGVSMVSAFIGARLGFEYTIERMVIIEEEDGNIDSVKTE